MPKSSSRTRHGQLGRSTGHVRVHNRAIVLGLLRKHGRLSRSALAELANLSLPTVLEIVDDLVADRFVAEAGQGPSSGGRPPRLCELVLDAHSVIGLSLGTETVTGVLVTLDADIRAAYSEPSRMALGPDALRVQVNEFVDRLTMAATNESCQLLGIGMGVPAPVSDPLDHRFSAPLYENWGEIDFHAELAGRGVPVVVDNYANALALGEQLFGAARGARNVLCVVLQAGVGAAVIADGNLYRGAHGSAGEIGGVAVDSSQIVLNRAADTTLTGILGRSQLLREFRERLGKSGADGWNGTVLARLTFEDLAAAGNAGDPIATAVISDAAERLGSFLAVAASILDPELVVLAGSTMRLIAVILPAVIRSFGRAFVGPRTVPVRAGTLGDRAGAVGASALITHYLFNPMPGLTGSPLIEVGTSASISGRLPRLVGPPSLQ